jgi:hypothetical protein
MRFAGRFQRQHTIDHRPQPAVLQRRHDRSGERRNDRGLLGCRAGSQCCRDQRDTPPHHGAEVDGGLGPTLHPDHDDAPIGGDCVEVLSQIRRPHDVEHNVGSVAVGELTG